MGGIFVFSKTSQYYSRRSLSDISKENNLMACGLGINCTTSSNSTSGKHLFKIDLTLILKCGGAPYCPNQSVSVGNITVRARTKKIYVALSCEVFLTEI